MLPSKCLICGSDLIIDDYEEGIYDIECINHHYKYGKEFGSEFFESYYSDDDKRNLIITNYIDLSGKIYSSIYYIDNTSETIVENKRIGPEITLKKIKQYTNLI